MADLGPMMDPARFVPCGLRTSGTDESQIGRSSGGSESQAHAMADITVSTAGKDRCDQMPSSGCGDTGMLCRSSSDGKVALAHLTNKLTGAGLGYPKYHLRRLSSSVVFQPSPTTSFRLRRLLERWKAESSDCGRQTEEDISWCCKSQLVY